MKTEDKSSRLHFASEQVSKIIIWSAVAVWQANKIVIQE